MLSVVGIYEINNIYIPVLLNILEFVPYPIYLWIALGIFKFLKVGLQFDLPDSNRPRIDNKPIEITIKRKDKAGS